LSRDGFSGHHVGGLWRSSVVLLKLPSNIQMNGAATARTAIERMA
jgi:hypothetical protein